MSTLQDLKISDLQTFCIVMEQGSITGAALALTQTKEAVARAIEKLERVVGEPLFDHTMRTSQATGLAVQLFDSIGPKFHDIVEVLGKTNEGLDDADGMVRISAPLDLSVHALPAFVTQFIRENPAIEPFIKPADRPMDLIMDGLDMAVKITRMDPIPDEIYYAEACGTLDLALYASIDFDANALTKPEDLANFRLVYSAAAEFENGLEFINAHGQVNATPLPKRTLRTGDFSSLWGYLADERLVALMPEPIGRIYEQRGQIQRVARDWHCFGGHLYLVSHAPSALSTRVAGVRTALLEHLKSLVMKRPAP